tara:strand:+ start:1521 stop:2228 length:708 start_codon:yes stop_codon:yes gene_type:complete
MTEFFVAFGAGLISFLSPCVLPLIPGYISYVSGTTLDEIKNSKNINLTPLILFTLGFSVVFITFGATASFIGKVLLQNSDIFRIAAGVIIILFSLHVLNIFNIKFLNYEKKIHTNFNPSLLSSFLIGMAFGFGWTPCIGPILGSILLLASTEENINRGISLLAFYSLGLAVPFILSGYLFQKFLSISKNLKSNVKIFSNIGGCLLLLTGILIITNQLQIIGFYLLEYIPFFQNFG